jgi:predicted MFS family arabinose efflux permease
MTRSPDPEAGAGISRRLLILMAVGSGIAVANIYYIQPLLADIGRTFQASPSAMGVVAMLAQVGFATGVLVFVPLGDIGDRRQLIVIVLAGATISLIAVAAARSFFWMSAATFFVGTFSVAPQMFIPFAAHLAAPARRGRAVGTVMSGLLIGILMSRAMSGYVGARVGWRSVFWIASGLTLALAAAVGLTLPRSVGRTGLRYGQLIRSLWPLARREWVLRESALAGAMLFAAFSAFWSMLAFRLETPPLHYGSDMAGLFGLVGVVGAGASPVAGRMADRLNPRTNVQLTLAATIVAFAVFALLGHTLWGLLIGVIVLDAAVQAGNVTNQSRVHGLSADARNRLTTVYIVSFFLGGAAGSALGAYAWQHWRWLGVCLVGAVMPSIAAVKMFLADRE